MDRAAGVNPRAFRRVIRAACLAVACALVPASITGRALAAPPAATASPVLVIIADAPISKQAVEGAGIALGSPAGRAGLAKKARTAASDAGAQAVLFVRVTPRKGGRTVTLMLVAPGESDVVIDTTVDTPPSDDGAALVSTLAPALARLSPSSTSASTPEPGAPNEPKNTPLPVRPGEGEPPPPEQPSSLGGLERSILVFSAGGGTGARIFRYSDGLSPQLRTYDLAASPNLVLAAEVYPMARTSIPVLRGLGITGGFQHALGVSSQTSGGMSVTTTWLRAEGGLRLRLPFGVDEREGPRFVLGLHGGVVKERFGFKGDASLTNWLPDVDYLFWRAGADGRLRAGPVGIMAGAAFMPAIQSGQLADRFRETKFAAVELTAGLAIPIVRIFEVRATAVYTRVFYSFHPEVGDLYVAGGALDNLVRAQIFATLLL